MNVLTALKHKQILVLGLGLTGLSCVQFLHDQGLCFSVNDSREDPFSANDNNQQFNKRFPNASLSLGQWDKALIAQADLIIISPGIDVVAQGIDGYISNDCKVWGDIELFCQFNNELDFPISILAVTGSNGKSTVVSLLQYLGEKLGINSQLAGNIGQPVLDLLTSRLNIQKRIIQDEKKLFSDQLFILELSSFQLETLSSMNAIAASILNISDDHLDRHITFDNYQSIKQRIYQQSNIAIVNRDDSSTSTLNNQQKVISFGSDKAEQGHFGIDTVNNVKHLMFGTQALIALDKLPLAGVHNALNYLATFALGTCAGWSLELMVENVTGFTGLSHRCQRVNSDDGVAWINDSKATNVGATIAAIDGLSQLLPQKNKLILIAGGDGKGADFSPLKHELRQHVDQLITLGRDGDLIAKFANKAIAVGSLQQAVQTAKQIANEGDMVLLSPACASFDMFKSYSDRGEQFMLCVQKLAEAS